MNGYSPFYKSASPHCRGDVDVMGPEMIKYLQCRYLAEEHESERAFILKTLARCYLAAGKRSLAHMCLSQTLGRHTHDKSLVSLVESLTDVSPPKPFLAEKNRCLISVIVPTYNRPEELRVCLMSILGQTLADFEIIVVNDGGNPEAQGVVDSLRDNRLSYCRLSENRGLPAARNEGLRRATGKYVAYLDDDDIFYDHHLEMLVTFLEHHPEVEVAYANAWWIYGEISDGVFMPRKRTLLAGRPRQFDLAQLFQGNYISTLNIVHTRSVLAKTGLFNEELPKLEDWDLLLRLSLVARFAQLPSITGEYRWKHNNISLASGKDDMEFWWKIVRGYYATFCGTLPVAIYYAAEGNRAALARTLQRIAAVFERYPKSEEIMKSLDACPYDAEPSLFRALARAYLHISPRNCLRTLWGKRSLRMALAIAPILPARLLRAMVIRCRQFAFGFKEQS